MRSLAPPLKAPSFIITICVLSLPFANATAAQHDVISRRCLDCHDSETKKAGLDLESLRLSPETFDTWVRVHDAVRDGDMPPKKKAPLSEADRSSLLGELGAKLIVMEKTKRANSARTVLRRMNRTEYENTVRDLLDLPGLPLRDMLPEDGRAFGYDKVGGALDLSHVQLAKYMEAADRALDAAIATRPEPQELFKERLHPGDQYQIKIVITNGDAVCLKDFRYDPAVLPTPIRDKSEKRLGDFEKEKLFPYRGSVGIFRHDDDAFHAEFRRFAPVVPGFYRIRTSLWSFVWDKGEVKPSQRTEVGALTAKGRTLGWFDAPSLKPREHEIVAWLNPGETIVFNAASLARLRVSEKKGRAAEFTGPGIAIDWLDIEGPLVSGWPSASHKLLLGESPLKEFDTNSDVTPPRRLLIKQTVPSAQPRYITPKKPWMIASEAPEADARRLLASFLPRAFRRPLRDGELERYLGLVRERLAKKDCFESAMRVAYTAALCSPEFLFLDVTKTQSALASRLSYFLSNSAPDAELTRLAIEGKLSDTATLRAQAERLLADAKITRFINDFTDQWLDQRDLDVTSPDPKLYPEFRPILHDAMPAETRAFFRELLTQNLSVANFIDSDFAMLNQRLGDLYGLWKNETRDSFARPRPANIASDTPHLVTMPLPLVDGTTIRKVVLPKDSQRGGLLTQAAILKVTANGTTTSPVKRGAWVMRKIMGLPPKPPPPSIPAVEPDLSGVTTIRQQLEKHRADAACSTCHAKMDPPGIALESYDVIGGWRDHYRSLDKGEHPARPPIGAELTYFKVALPVDAAGELADGRPFAGIADLKKQLLTDQRQLARNFINQLVTYATGTPVSFIDRAEVERILDRTAARQFLVRDLLLEVVQSDMFRDP